MILHPGYNSTAGDSADLAIVKLEPRRDTGPIQVHNTVDSIKLENMNTTFNQFYVQRVSIKKLYKANIKGECQYTRFPFVHIIPI